MLKTLARRAALAALIVAAPALTHAQDRLAPNALPAADRPFGTLREQAALQQAWLKKRLDTFLPPLMRAHGIDFWVVPMREYNEDPVFPSITAPETFAARRRTIYVFFDKCAAAGTPPSASCVERTRKPPRRSAVNQTQPEPNWLTPSLTKACFNRPKSPKAPSMADARSPVGCCRGRADIAAQKKLWFQA